MSYQVLARKWRPKTFSELMGQEHVVSVLVNAISQQRLHHAYLFTGTRGVGKTTIARIFAKSLNCEVGVTAEPCGKCDICLDIDQGRFVDLLEIDAASRTKVDDTREILDNVQYAPTRGRYKVYLIDEVHMLSRSSFNALLKTLEEPPEHVKFILATTDPQKLPITVLSRCLQFHLKALSVSQIEQQLDKILSAESVTSENECLNMLAKAARGSMRDSLSLTDQAIAQGQGHITLANLQQMLGGIDQHWPYKILIALLKQDAQGLMELSKEIASFAPSYNRLFAELIQLLHHVALYQVVEQHFDLSPEHASLIKKFSQTMSAQDIQLYYQLALNGRKDLPYAFDEQAAFDMTLLRLLAFKPMAQADVAETQTETAQLPPNFDDVQLESTKIANNSGVIEENVPESTQLDTEILDELAATEEVASAKPVELIDQKEQVEQVGAEEYHLDNDDVTDEPTATLNAELLAVEQSAAEQHVAASFDKVEQHTSATAERIEDTAINENVAPTDSPSLIENNITEQIESISTKATEAPEATANEESVTKEISSPKIESGILSASVESALATRNMLRSRKKKLESEAKKSNDVETRPESSEKINKPKFEVPDIDSLPEQGFEIQSVDPSIVKKANQVDKWANMIDAMALNGRLRVLAQQAIISPSTTDEHLVLELNQSAKHLKTDVAMEQLQSFVSDHFSQSMQVEVNIVEDTVDDPLKIQGQINEKRYDYAKALLQEDPLIQRLQNEFQAVIDESTIIAR
ncbi:DNA polymerase III subunit gamma/tau [Thalassotalea sp. M1531]|uniref:DNA polymerase III subunit gamma/tau n=1 Tax=Thalassotalea algicola TaxID=2716224 RepID=A0A7Y0LFP1_9GAMM|nr:DNA polymerase III subunit gamma/tau [Thalassotalea algicola]NMP33382.1 DNA polymerase III subunit gamma/tau [Thalassotalea algicola]